MTSKERVMTALDFGQPDRVPLFDTYWPEWVSRWRTDLSLKPTTDPSEYYAVDIRIAAGDETLAPSRAEVLAQTPDTTLRRDGWGRVISETKGAYFSRQLEDDLLDPSRFADLPIDPPESESRYAHLDPVMEQWKQRYCVFAKVGGPFIRTCFLRGEANYLMDLAADPHLAAELALWMARHLTSIGLEELRRWDLYDTGIWVYDDMASLQGPMFSPRTAEKVLAPAWAYMIKAFRAAGARKIIFHSDGNLGPVLDLLVDLGFDGINPVEPRAGLRASELRARYGNRLALVGGICNSVILPAGDESALHRHVLDVLSAGKEGGLVLGSHSIGPDIAPAVYNEFIRFFYRHADYPLQLPAEEAV
ncbi:hypothetical protein LLH03_03100 [bacterium]|nr:hypothetical protein [bacterium]